jgi:hypothetical protein
LDGPLWIRYPHCSFGPDVLNVAMYRSLVQPSDTQTRDGELRPPPKKRNCILMQTDTVRALYPPNTNCWDSLSLLSQGWWTWGVTRICSAV